MPQVRCPNCGLTINLENRKETDMRLITEAVKGDARTFTELLHRTRLPRKTLNLRLKELCQNGVLTKGDGTYKLNGTYSPARSIARFSGIIHDKRMKGILMLAMVLVGIPMVSYGLAALFPLPANPVTYQEPQILGTFTAVLKVYGVHDLYSWQAVISFDPTELKVLLIRSGQFIEAEYPFFVSASDVGDGLLLVGSTLAGDVLGVNGDGTLAVIVFGYFVKDYKTQPQVLQSSGAFETRLLDSNNRDISVSDSTLRLVVEGNH